MTLPIALWEMTGVPVPSVSPGTGTLFCIGINETWRKFLLGAMEGLLLDVFEGDETDKTNGYNYARELIGIIQQAIECESEGVAEVSVPIGGVIDYGGESAPTHFILCNGVAISRATYSELFAVIGTTYGSGDGSSTFNLPNLADRYRKGAGTDPNGYTGGADTVTLTVNQIPSHRHGFTSSTAVSTGAYPARGNSTVSSTAHNTAYEGGGASHENNPPFLCMYPYMRYE